MSTGQCEVSGLYPRDKIVVFDRHFFKMVFGIVLSISFVNVVLSRLGLDVGLGLVCLFVVFD